MSHEKQTFQILPAIPENQLAAHSTHLCPRCSGHAGSGHRRTRGWWWGRYEALILLLALAAGLIVGLVRAYWHGYTYHISGIRYTWLAIVAFLPQFVAFYLPASRVHQPNWLAAASQLLSLVPLLVFTWINRRLPGMGLLIFGQVLNLAVIATNGGFMPISPQTAERLIPTSVVQSLHPGSRFGTGKDILLLPQDTRLEWLADRLLPPAWFPYQVAFSLGDVFIALGAFWLLASQGTSPLQPKKKQYHDPITTNAPNIPSSKNLRT